MKLNFLVIGEICTDKFIYGKASRLSPEAPVPIFTPIKTQTNGGMALNTYNNLLAIINKNDKKHSVDTILSELCSTKIRYVDIKTNHYFLRVDEEDKFDRFKIDATIKKKILKADCIIISDYDKGYLNIEDFKKIYNLKKISTPIFLDTKKKLCHNIFHWVDYIKVNESEYYDNIESYDRGYYKKKIIATLGDKGASFDNQNYPSVNPQNTIDVSGAGDTFMAAMCYKYMDKRDIPEAITYANIMAAQVVMKRGVSTI